MAETIFRYIDGVLRPIKVSNIKAGKQSVTTVNQHHQIPKQQLAAGHYRTPHAFTIPNATCQVCGAKVFYYEHPNGARVLFDQLGPPWPKHPCYEAGQAFKHNVISQATTSSVQSWEKEGWQPLFHEKHILLQSGSSIRLQARTDRYQVIFEIQIAELQRRHIQIEQLDKLLMQAKQGHGKAWIQIHDGSHSFEIMTTNVRLIEQKAPTVLKELKEQSNARLTDGQLASLSKLEVTIKCHHYHHIKKWHVNLARLEQSHSISFTEKSFQHFKPFIHTLEAWVSKPNKKKNRTLFLLEPSSHQYINAVISNDVFLSLVAVVENPEPLTSVASLGVQAERLEVSSVTPYLAASKLVCGTLGERQIKIRVDDRLFRLGESAAQITAGNILISLRQVKDPEESKAEFALYINKAGELMSARPRGYVSQLAREALVSPVSSANKDNIDRAGQRTVMHKAFSVTLSSVDLSKDEKICLVVTDKQQEYRLRLHSVAKKVRGQIVALSKNHHRHTTHLVKRSGHSYQFHIDGQFIVMATEEAFFEQKTSRSTDDISVTRE